MARASSRPRRPSGSLAAPCCFATLRNALLPIITGIGLVYGWSLGGEFLIEVMFSWPGLGTYAVDSILAQDFAPVQAVVLVTATVYVVVNLIVDLLSSPSTRVQVSS